VDSDAISLPLSPTKDAGDPEALYEAVWTLLTQTIRKNTKHRSARTVLEDYLDDAREDGGGTPRALEFVFLSPSSACDVQMAVTAHWFELAIALAREELAALGALHGYKIKLPKAGADTLANAKRQTVFVPSGDAIFAVSKAKNPLVAVDGESETALEEAELSAATRKKALEAVRSGRCACVLCETVRKKKAVAAKPQSALPPDPAPAPTKDATFKTAAAALRKPDACVRLDLSKQNQYRSARIHYVELPEAIGQLRRLVELDTTGTVNNSLPASLFTLTSLERLRLGHLASLVDGVLPDGIGNLTRLVEFCAGGIARLPATFANLVALESLTLRYTGAEFPSFVTKLPRLRSLDLRTERGTKLPDLGRLGSLRQLSLEGGTGTIRFAALRELESLRWTGLQAWPSGLRDLPKLRRLELGRSFLPAIPPEIATLPALEEIHGELSQLTEWPERLPELKTIAFTSLSRLKSLDGLRAMPRLETLVLRDLTLTALPKRAPALPALKTLDLRYARELKSLPRWIAELPSLERICLALVPLPEAELAGLRRARPNLNVDLYII